MAPRLKLRDIALFERPVPFVRPFRFGAVTIRAATQNFVRVEIEVEGKGISVGATAELLAPSSGEILVDGERVTKPHGNVGIVFQN